MSECNVVGCSNPTDHGFCQPCRDRFGKPVTPNMKRVNAAIAQARETLDLPTREQREAYRPKKRKLLAEMTREELDAIGGCTCKLKPIPGTSDPVQWEQDYSCDYCRQFMGAA